MQFKRQCYLHGIVASAVYNVNRTESGQHVFSASDFIPRCEEQSQREEIIMLLKQQFIELKPEQMEEARTTWIATLLKKGRSDAFEIVEEVMSF